MSAIGNKRISRFDGQVCRILDRTLQIRMGNIGRTIIRELPGIGSFRDALNASSSKTWGIYDSLLLVEIDIDYPKFRKPSS